MGQARYKIPRLSWSSLCSTLSLMSWDTFEMLSCSWCNPDIWQLYVAWTPAVAKTMTSVFVVQIRILSKPLPAQYARWSKILGLASSCEQTSKLLVSLFVRDADHLLTTCNNQCLPLHQLSQLLSVQFYFHPLRGNCHLSGMNADGNTLLCIQHPQLSLVLAFRL